MIFYNFSCSFSNAVLTSLKKYCKTAVKAHVTHTLPTRVRATGVFQKSTSKKRFSYEHVFKVWRFDEPLLIFVWVLKRFLKTLQKCSEKLKSAIPRARV